MHARRPLATGNQELSPPVVFNGFDIKDPFHRLYSHSKPSEFTFDGAYDHLGIIISFLENHIKGQYTSPLPPAHSIIALLDHIAQTVEVAFSKIGFQLHHETSNSLQYPNDQTQPEETLERVYNNWVCFIKVAKGLCEQPRPRPISPTFGHPSTSLGGIVEGSPTSEWTLPYQERQNPRHPYPRRDSRDTSPTKKSSSSSRVGSVASSTVANSTVGKRVKLYVHLHSFVECP